MAFNKKVLKLLKEKKRTKAQLAKAVGIPYTTLDSMLKRESDTSRLDMVFKIAEYLGVSVEELVYEERIGENADKSEISDEEHEILDKIRTLDDRGKDTILKLLDIEVIASGKSSVIESIQSMRSIAVYNSPAAAGEALPILNEDYEMREIADVPSETSFAIKISGDSMEPYIEDGSLVFVKQQDTIEHGDIGIFILNGESLCKKFSNQNGSYHLVSLNTKYNPIDILETDDLRVVGKVLM